jgi:DnaJ-class molecular chaperone
MNTDLIDPSRNYYEMLRLMPIANSDEIKKAYKKMAIANHPDRGGDEETMKAINEAYAVLGDAQTRAYYDRIRAEFTRTSTWSMGGGGGNPFEDIENKSLVDFVVDSISMFQEVFSMEIPEAILDNFQDATQFVYGIWRGLKSEGKVGYVNFAGVRVRDPYAGIEGDKLGRD